MPDRLLRWVVTLTSLLHEQVDVRLRRDERERGSLTLEQALIGAALVGLASALVFAMRGRVIRLIGTIR